MKVILLQDVKKVGSKGDVLEVKEGYARNYLLPRKLAVEATDGYLKDLKNKKDLEAQKQAQKLEEAKQLAKTMETIKVIMPTKVGEAGKLFGSITSKDIADALKKQHQIKLDKKKIELQSPIKSLGEYSISVKLHPKVQAHFLVNVVEE